MTKLIPLLGFILGPCCVYLLWAIMSRRWGHVASAVAVNIIFWSGGLMLLKLIVVRLT
jgi:hypothetical protein